MRVDHYSVQMKVPLCLCVARHFWDLVKEAVTLQGAEMKRVTELSWKLVQCINIYFCVKIGLSLANTRRGIDKVFGEEAISRSRVNFWHKEFCEGHTQLVDLYHHPKRRTGHSAQNIQAVQTVINADK